MGGNGSAYSEHIKDAVFVIPSPALLSRVVAGISDLPTATGADTDVDSLGICMSICYLNYKVLERMGNLERLDRLLI